MASSALDYLLYCISCAFISGETEADEIARGLKPQGSKALPKSAILASYDPKVKSATDANRHLNGSWPAEIAKEALDQYPDPNGYSSIVELVKDNTGSGGPANTAVSLAIREKARKLCAEISENVAMPRLFRDDPLSYLGFGFLEETEFSNRLKEKLRNDFHGRSPGGGWPIDGEAEPFGFDVRGYYDNWGGFWDGLGAIKEELNSQLIRECDISDVEDSAWTAELAWLVERCLSCVIETLVLTGLCGARNYGSIIEIDNRDSAFDTDFDAEAYRGTETATGMLPSLLPINISRDDPYSYREGVGEPLKFSDYSPVTMGRQVPGRDSNHVVRSGQGRVSRIHCTVSYDENRLSWVLRDVGTDGSGSNAGTLLIRRGNGRSWQAAYLKGDSRPKVSGTGNDAIHVIEASGDSKPGVALAYGDFICLAPEPGSGTDSWSWREGDEYNFLFCR